LPKLFVTGTKQRFIWRFFTKKSGIFPDFSRIFPDFPDFGLNNAKKVRKTTLKIRISGQNPKIFSNKSAIILENPTYTPIL